MMLEKVRLGRTNLMVSRVAMGCIPIQRLSHDEAVKLLLGAYDSGVNFYDTAHVYSDSEEKLGAAFASGKRQRVVIATKALCSDYATTMRQLEESLRRLRTDYIDIYQWHNPEEDLAGFLDRRGPYQAMLDAKRDGKVRFIGFTNHNLARARHAIASEAFDTLQYPLSVLSAPEELEFARECADLGIGVIAMKAMCGGMLEDGRLPFVFLNQFPHIVPIWGIEKAEELDQFIRLAADPEPFTAAMRAEAERLRRELGETYCRGCGYCLPCPVSINIPLMMRIVCFVNRNREGSQFTEARLAEVAAIDKCLECRECVTRCPYHLDIPGHLKEERAGFAALHGEYQAKIRTARDSL